MRIRFSVLRLAFALLAPGVWAQGLEVPLFSDVTAAAGITFTHMTDSKTDKKYIFQAKGAGVGLLDYDSDGWLDLLLVQGSTLERMKEGRHPHGRLYRNRRDGTFQDVTEAARLTRPAWGMGVTFGDYDNDGFADIYVTNLGPNILYRNSGDGTFEDVTAQAGVGDPRWSSSAAMADYDGDGDLDLYVCNYISLDFDRLPQPGSSEFCTYRGRPGMCGPRGLAGAPNTLYRNNGDGTFSDVTRESGAFSTPSYYSLGAVWGDVDNDGDPDLFVSNDSAANQFFINRGDGSFEEAAFMSGLAASLDGRFQAGMGVDIADYDNDGLLDVFSTHFANDYNTLYRNLGGSLFEDVSDRAGIGESVWLLVSWGTRLVDLNHDGWKDIVHVNGHTYPYLIEAGWAEEYHQPPTLFLNRGDGTFTDASRRAGADFQKKSAGRGAAFGDIDNDGDIDLAIANLDSSPVLYRNDLDSDSHWVMFRTRGSSSNRDGIGTRITVTTGGLSQVWEIKRALSVYSASDPRAHFGLGRAVRVDRVEVRWPGGKVQKFTDVAADAHYVIDEEQGLSREFG